MSVPPKHSVARARCRSAVAEVQRLLPRSVPVCQQPRACARRSRSAALRNGPHSGGMTERSATQAAVAVLTILAAGIALGASTLTRTRARRE
jgi:hypothetical protein